jgi:dTDP-4-amino-4,6-dideoxygalactose transaminase
MPKILHLLPPGAGDQHLTEILALARELAESRVTSEILIGREAASGVRRHDGITVVEYPWPPGDGPAATAEGLAAGLRTLVERLPGCDLVQAHDLVFTPRLAALGRGLTGIRFVTSADHDDPAAWTGDSVEQRLLDSADYGETLIGNPGNRTAVAAVAPGWRPLLMPSPIDPVALALPPAETRVRDRIVVAGPAPGSLLALVGNLCRTHAPGLSPTPADGHDTPGETLRHAALLVLTGTAADAEHDLTLAAAAAGVPVLAAAGTEATSLLGPDYPGLLPHPVDELTTPELDAWVDRLTTSRDRDVADRLALVRKTVLDRYSPTEIAARHGEIYRAVLAGRKPPEWEGPGGRIPMALPDITGAEVRAAGAALLSGKLSVGNQVADFEREFAEFHGRAEAVAVNSAASALYAGLVGAGIRGEVLVPSFTWSTTANVVVAAGATPVWVDIEPETLGIDPEAAAAAITPQTEAMICVHFAGHPCRVAELAALCERYGLLLIEDAAEAAGARQNGALVGTFGMGCYSFYGTKNMTTGEGGMVLTDDPELAGRTRRLRAHGMRPVPGSPYPWHKEAVLPGFNFRMPEPLAAVGRIQLARLDGMNDQRRDLAARYDTALAELSDRLRPHAELPGFRHVYHMYVVQLADRARRNEVVTQLRALGVEASVHFDPPVHAQAFYQQWYPAEPGRLPVTDRVAASVITLPLYTTMSGRSVDRVVDALTRVLDRQEAR